MGAPSPNEIGAHASPRKVGGAGTPVFLEYLPGIIIRGGDNAPFLMGGETGASEVRSWPGAREESQVGPLLVVGRPSWFSCERRPVGPASSRGQQVLLFHLSSFSLTGDLFKASQCGSWGEKGHEAIQLFTTLNLQHLIKALWSSVK